MRSPWWRIDGGGSVVADRWWTAKQVVDLLPIRWSYGPNHDVSSAKITDSMREGLDTDEIDIGRKDGDLDRALATAVKRIEAIYTLP
jgi:isoquinoline 1-oxidoreductase beta subunit